MNIAERVDQYLQQEFGDATSSVYRDLSLNLKKLLEDGQLDPNERFMNLLAIATTLENKPLAQVAIENLRAAEFTPEQIRECAESAGIMGMNNVYYKFRGFLDDGAREAYTRAGLRMQSMMKPQNGKHNFEMMSLAVSIVNGCPTCVASHEKAVRDLGVSTEKIHDIARLAAVSKGLSSHKAAQEILG